MRNRVLIFAIMSLSALLSSCGQGVLDDDTKDIPEPKEDKIAKRDAVFNEDNLPRLVIEITQDEWNKLLDKYDADHSTREYVRCDVSFQLDGDHIYEVSDVGLRLRGQTSRRRPEGDSGHHQRKNAQWHRVHFGLNFRKFVDDSDHDIKGVRRINLKYAKEDPTYVREHYCFDLLERYGVWTAPKTSWCRLSIHVRGDAEPAYFGVYLMMESIDNSRYVKNRPQFGTGEGYLWKCACGSNLRDKDDWRFHLEDSSTETYAYELKHAEPADFPVAKKQLLDFITKVNSLKGAEFYNWIQEVMDVDLLLRMYAVNVAVGHWDDYWNDMNNFYLYFNSTDPQKYMVYMLPYDYDNTLGTSHNCGVQNDSGRHDPYHWGLDECVLISKILSVSDFKDKYTEYLKELSSDDNDLFNYAASSARIDKWQNMISPFLGNVMGESTQLSDRPASWGNHGEYRIMKDGDNNWFRVKCASLKKWINK